MCAGRSRGSDSQKLGRRRLGLIPYYRYFVVNGHRGRVLYPKTPDREYEKGTEVLQRAVSEKPTNERMHAGLMRLYALSDRPVQALVQYEHLREILSGQLDAEPSSTATRRLRDEIAAGRLPPTYLAATPPEDSPDASKHNLPAPRTKFIGREREVVEVKRRLAMTNLLTLTGAGGCGKTRLALKVARDLVGTYPDGVWLVGWYRSRKEGWCPTQWLGFWTYPSSPIARSPLRWRRL